MDDVTPFFFEALDARSSWRGGGLCFADFTEVKRVVVIAVVMEKHTHARTLERFLFDH
jgi:hypothetical protein